MSKTLYLSRNTAIINFNQGFPKNSLDLVNSNSFKQLLDVYFTQAPKRYVNAIRDVSDNDDLSATFIEFIRQLLVYKLDAIKHPLIEDLHFINALIEDVYEFWRNYQRCTIVYISAVSRKDLISFIDRDNDFNLEILDFYRTLQEKIKGRTNKIYRQLKAGSNACITLREKKTLIPDDYKMFRSFHFIDSVLLHSPLILHPQTNKREGHFKEVFTNPLDGLKLKHQDYFCYPAKVGSLLIYVFFHRDFTFSGISLANLFEPATSEEMARTKPDGIIAFGVEDGKDDMDFFIDADNDLVAAKISHQPKIEYFGYMKKIMLTVYNVAMMHKGWLPIHGSMVNIYTNNKRYGVVFMGDSGAGKSEIIEEMTHLGKNLIDHMEVVFDDMGVFHYDSDGKVVAQGTEIGAFVRLDDLDRGLPYQQMDRSIFMNPESTNNARVIVPVSTFDIVSTDHKVDYFLYANNYDAKIGVEFFADPEDAKGTFVEGKRMAKATTHEVGITTSFFANPFGPLQQEEKCLPLIDDYFRTLIDSQVKIGQVFTNLGVIDRDEDSLKNSAKALLDLIKQA